MSAIFLPIEDTVNSTPTEFDASGIITRIIVNFQNVAAWTISAPINSDILNFFKGLGELHCFPTFIRPPHQLHDIFHNILWSIPKHTHFGRYKAPRSNYFFGKKNGTRSWAWGELIPAIRVSRVTLEIEMWLYARYSIISTFIQFPKSQKFKLPPKQNR